jgi:hypothetical protein
LCCFHPTLTTHGKSITVHFIRGIGTFFTLTPDDSCSEESDDEIEALGVRSKPSGSPAPAISATTTNGNNHRMTISANPCKSIKENRSLKEEKTMLPNHLPNPLAAVHAMAALPLRLIMFLSSILAKTS